MKALIIDKVKIHIKTLEEQEPIEKALGFEFTGADHSEYIAKVKQDNGFNPWIWCAVEVSAHFAGLTGYAYLGCCAYENEADFIKGGYYEQMQQEAFADLKTIVENVLFELEKV